MTQKLPRRRRRRIIETVEELEDSIIAYLDLVDLLNSPRFVIYDAETGIEYESEEKANDAGVTTIRKDFEPVPVYALTKYTIGGFCQFMGISYGTYYGFKKREDLVPVIEWFETILEDQVEQLLLNPTNRNASGAMKVAVNRYEWVEKSEVEQTVRESVTFQWDIPSGDNKVE